MALGCTSSPSWVMTSFGQQADPTSQSATTISRWPAPSEDFFHCFVNANSFDGRNEDDESDFPLDYSNDTDLVPPPSGIDNLDVFFSQSLIKNSDEAQNSWHGEPVLGDGDPALPSFDDAFSANHALNGGFLSAEDDTSALERFDPQMPELNDLVALPSSPSMTPGWTINTNELDTIESFKLTIRRGGSPHIDTSGRNDSLSSRQLNSPQTRGRQPSRQHTMLARRWEDPALSAHIRSKSMSGQQALTPAHSSHSYYSRHEDGTLPSPSAKIYFPRIYHLEADSTPLYRNELIPEDGSNDLGIEHLQNPGSPIGSPMFDTAMENRNSTFHDAQPGLTFSSYPSTPRSHADDPTYPMTPPQSQPTESRTWTHDQADALHINKAEEWWNKPIGQSEVTCGAPTAPRTLGLGIRNLQSANLGSRVDRLFTPDSMAPTPNHSQHFSYSDGASASFDQIYNVPQAQMMPMHPQERIMHQRTHSHNQMLYPNMPATCISPAQMSNQSFIPPVPINTLAFMNDPSRASNMGLSTRPPSIAFSRASSYTRSSQSLSPAPQTRTQRRGRKSNRRSTSRATDAGKSGTGARSSGAADMCGFINFTPSDKKRILTGVAPSGSSKTKARREKEAKERERKMSEAARRAVLSGDLGMLERSGVFRG